MTTELQTQLSTQMELTPVATALQKHLKRVRIYLKAKKGAGITQDDYDFDALGDAGKGKGGYLDKWMHGTNPGTGTLYCHPDMEAYWVNVWTWYGDANQFANRPKKWSIETWTSYDQGQE